jgi:hypothetical protein
VHAGKASERSQRRFVPRCLSHAGQQPLVLLTTNRLADRAKGHRRNVDRIVHPRYLSDAVEREIENVEIA